MEYNAARYEAYNNNGGGGGGYGGGGGGGGGYNNGGAGGYNNGGGGYGGPAQTPVGAAVKYNRAGGNAAAGPANGGYTNGMTQAQQDRINKRGTMSRVRSGVAGYFIGDFTEYNRTAFQAPVEQPARRRGYSASGASNTGYYNNNNGSYAPPVYNEGGNAELGAGDYRIQRKRQSRAAATTQLPVIQGMTLIPIQKDPSVLKEEDKEFLDDVDGEPMEEFVPYFPFFMNFMTFVDVVMLIAEIIYNRGFEKFNLNPFLGPSSETLIAFGAKFGPLILAGQVWRFISPVILHVGIIHLMINMATQVKVGRQMEMVFGAHRVAPIYLLSAVGGNMMSVIFLPNEIQVGASGALYGLLGACLIDLLNNWSKLPNPKRALGSLLVQIVISFIVGLLPFVDNFAHIGGFITGLLTSVIFFPQVIFGEVTVENRVKHLLAAIILLILYFAIGFGIFFGQNNPLNWCPGCFKLDCVELGPTNWCQQQSDLDPTTATVLVSSTQPA